MDMTTKQSSWWMKPAIAAGLTVLISAGCGMDGGKQAQTELQPKGQQEEKPKVEEPVTLTVWGPTASLWEELYVAPMKKKFPHITLVEVKNAAGSKLPELIAAGNPPDIIQGAPNFIYEIMNNGLQYDMTSLIAKNKFDIGKINPIAVQTLQGYTGSKEIFGLPITLNNGALYYNKDIFNKFAIPFPKDGMTWNDAIDLGKQIDNKNGDATYRGLMIQLGSHITYNQLSLPFVDRNKEVSLVNTSQWQSYFNLLKEMHATGKWTSADLAGKEIEYFINQKRIGMISITNILSLMKDAMAAGLDWDMVSMPTVAERPNTGFTFNGPVHYISSTSKHKEQAFAVISHFLSDEVQMLRSKAGEPSVLTNPEILAAYGTNLPHLKGKNVTAIVPKNIAPVSASISKYDSIASGELQLRLREVIVGNKDVNTALREADENINKKIQAEKAK